MNKQPQPIETMSVLALAFLALHLLTENRYLLYAGIMLLVTGIFVKPLASVVHKGWMLFANYLGKFNGIILLSVLFFAILTPLAWLYRLFSKDNLQLKKRVKQSYFTDRNHTFTAKDLEKMW